VYTYNRKLILVVVAIAAIVVALVLYHDLSSGPTTITPQQTAVVCSTSNTTIERAGAATTVHGVSYETISITNRLPSTCTVPALVLARAYDAQTHLVIGSNATVHGAGSAVPVSLAAHVTAYFQFAVEPSRSVKGCAPVQTETVQFSLGDGEWVAVTNPLVACSVGTDLSVYPVSVPKSSTH